VSSSPRSRHASFASPTNRIRIGTPFIDTVQPQDSHSGFAHSELGRTKASLDTIQRELHACQVAGGTRESTFWKGGTKSHPLRKSCQGRYREVNSGRQPRYRTPRKQLSAKPSSHKRRLILLDEFQERCMIDVNQCYSILLFRRDFFVHAPKNCNSPHSDYSRTD